MPIRLRLLLIVLLVAVSPAAPALAQSAPASGEASAAAPVHLMLPRVDGSHDDWRVCLGLHLREQLAHCAGVDVIDDERAHQWSGWLRSRAFDLTPQQYWNRLTRAVPLDVAVQFIVDQEQGTLEFVVSTAAGAARTAYNIQAQSLPEIAQDVGRQLAQTLGLAPAEAALLTDVAIDDPISFRAYYRSQSLWARWPANPYRGMLLELADAKLQGEPQWALEAARLRVSVGYLAATTRYMDRTQVRIAQGIVPRSLAAVLGSPAESAARDIEKLRDPQPELFAQVERVLLDMARPLTFGAAGADAARERIGALEALGDLDALDAELPSVMDTPTALSAQTGQIDIGSEQRLGAVRLLGLIGSDESLAMLKNLSQRADADVRAAVAVALADAAGEAGLDVLRTLAADDQPVVALQAHRSLWRRGQPLPDLPQQAHRMLEQQGPLRQAGAAILTASASAASGLLSGLARDADPQVRRLARRARAALPPRDAADLLARLNQPSSEALVAALSRVTPALARQVHDRLIELCNDVDNDVAWAARDALAPLRPTEPQAAAQFDLLTLHHYLRQRKLDELAARTEPWITALLTAACRNPEPHTRIRAMRLLLVRDPAAARPALIEATADPHRIVQLSACAMLEGAATADDIQALQAALAHVSDEVARLYLDAALARLRGEPPPPSPLPPARSVADKPNLTWLCGGGTPDSPYQAYYQLSLAPDDNWRKAYAAGKIFFARINPVSNPNIVISDRTAQDRVCLAVDAQLPRDALAVLDGVVYGEESMSMAPGTLWADAWRAFCAEAALDHHDIQGNIDNLTPLQRRAWNDWALRRAVDGFNFLYDYTRLRAGKLRPGLQVCTFLPTEMLHGSSATTADFQWKFDLGGIYHYIGDSRKTAYSLVRRYKTIWPDRPVLWLSHGIGCYERTPVKYDTRVPTAPLLSLSVRAYTDTVTAWLAGAQTGWFSIWPFQKHDWVNQGMGSLRGPSVRAEDIAPDSEVLRHAIAYSFAGVEQRYRQADGAKKIAHEEIGLEEFGETLDIQLEEPAEDPIQRRIRLEKQRMFQGFLFYRKYLFDLARLMASLPRPDAPSDQLVIETGLSLWEGHSGSPGADLLTHYDYLPDINMVDQLDLSRYRIITIRDPGPLRDDTIRALSRWLEQTAGLLYISRNLSADNADEAATAADLDGALQHDWPWESDLAIHPSAQPLAKPADVTLTGRESLTIPAATVASTLEVRGASAQVLYRHDDHPVLVRWRHPDHRGAVLFDGIQGGGVPYREVLRQQISSLAAQGIGKAVDGPIRMEQLANRHWSMTSTSGSPQPLNLAGVDMLTGKIDPVLHRKSAAVLAADFVGKYAAAHAGVGLLAEQPLDEVEQVAGGLRFRSAGLTQIVTRLPEHLDVRPLEGAPLAVIPPEQFNDWLLLSHEPGIATHRLESADGAVHALTYVRSEQPLRAVLQDPS